ncbi:hypothetical protein AB6D20_027685 (plasmid) [Vibrio splendidus]
MIRLEFRLESIAQEGTIAQEGIAEDIKENGKKSPKISKRMVKKRSFAAIIRRELFN